MQVRIVRMAVHEPFVSMPVGMRFAGRSVRRVLMLMMGIVHVPMLVFHCLVHVFVIVHFDQVQIQADPHQQRGGRETHRDRLSEDHDSQRRADEWRG